MANRGYCASRRTIRGLPLSRQPCASCIKRKAPQDCAGQLVGLAPLSNGAAVIICLASDHIVSELHVYPSRWLTARRNQYLNIPRNAGATTGFVEFAVCPRRTIYCIARGRPSAHASARARRRRSVKSPVASAWTIQQSTQMPASQSRSPLQPSHNQERNSYGRTRATRNRPRHCTLPFQ
jgi:hypothetical protein